MISNNGNGATPLFGPNGRAVRPPQDKASDLATKGDVIHAIVHNMGPIAAMLQELCDRHDQMATHVGFVYQPKAPDIAPPITPPPTEDGP